jgi:hypothetical protein
MLRQRRPFVGKRAVGGHKGAETGEEGDQEQHAHFEAPPEAATVRLAIG